MNIYFLEKQVQYCEERWRKYFKKLSIKENHGLSDRYVCALSITATNLCINKVLNVNPCKISCAFYKLVNFRQI